MSRPPVEQRTDRVGWLSVTLLFFVLCAALWVLKATLDQNDKLSREATAAGNRATAQSRENHRLLEAIQQAFAAQADRDRRLQLCTVAILSDLADQAGLHVRGVKVKGSPCKVFSEPAPTVVLPTPGPAPSPQPSSTSAPPASPSPSISPTPSPTLPTASGRHCHRAGRSHHCRPRKEHDE